MFAVLHKELTMNERIKEIWEEATVSVWPRPGKFTAGEYDYHIEKFAELIVQECADFIKPLGDWRGGHGEPPMPSTSELAKRLKEHFGVKE
jgi:hypothetical protein